MKNHWRALALAIGILIARLLHAQGTIWHFGDGAGLDFSSGSPVVITGGASYSLDNSTAATDPAGNLLFYSNGESVWDATHSMMPNGDGLLGDHDAGQSVLAVHRPGSSIFYIFTVDNWNGPNGLRYSVVDMDLNGGLGDVTLKNQLLHAPSTERLEAVRDPNDGSWWLISHDWGNSNFRSYRISTNGLSTTPVISSVGASHSGASYDSAGQLTASPDGTMLCCGIYTQNKFQVFDFDATTGIVSNPRDLPGYTNAWGCAFSPNSQRLYLTKWYNDELWQVDLSAGTWSQVASSAFLIGTTQANVSGWQAGYLQLAPDGKLYMATFGENSIACVSAPDALGNSCGYMDAAVDLGPGICKAGLCRTATNDACALSIDLPPPSGCAWSPLIIYAQVASSPSTWAWDFGDGTTSDLPGPITHTYYLQGQYTVSVSVTAANGTCSDSAQVTVLIGAPETAGVDSSITLCLNDPPLNLYTLLSPIADVNGIWTDENGVQVVGYFDPAVQSSTVLHYAINGVHCGPDTAEFTIDVVVCGGVHGEGKDDPILLHPNPAHDIIRVIAPPAFSVMDLLVVDALGQASIVRRVEHDSQVDVGVLAPGTYWMIAVASDGRWSAAPFVKLP